MVSKGSVTFDGDRIDCLDPVDIVRRGIKQLMEGRRGFHPLAGVQARRSGNQMQRIRIDARHARLAGCLAAAALAVAPATAGAQYTAPPPAPGYHYIFDGTATGSDASFDKWTDRTSVV